MSSAAKAVVVDAERRPTLHDRLAAPRRLRARRSPGSAAYLGRSRRIRPTRDAERQARGSATWQIGCLRGGRVSAGRVPAGAALCAGCVSARTGRPWRKAAWGAESPLPRPRSGRPARHAAPRRSGIAVYARTRVAATDAGVGRARCPDGAVVMAELERRPFKGAQTRRTRFPRGRQRASRIRRLRSPSSPAITPSSFHNSRRSVRRSWASWRFQYPGSRTGAGESVIVEPFWGSQSRPCSPLHPGLPSCGRCTKPHMAAGRSRARSPERWRRRPRRRDQPQLPTHHRFAHRPAARTPAAARARRPYRRPCGRQTLGRCPGSGHGADRPRACGVGSTAAPRSHARR